jgi:hypothetical protein
MTDCLGAGAAGAARTLPSSDSSILSTIAYPYPDDTWFKDCVANTPGTGTPFVAEFFNRFLQQVRRVIRNAGVTVNNADDDMLWKAILSTISTNAVARVPQTDFYVNNASSNSAGDTSGDGLTTGTSWYSLAHALTYLRTVNLGGQIITIHLANSGVEYAAPVGPIASPSSGTVITLGDPTAQSSYVISGPGLPNNGVLGIVGGTMSFSGVTIKNTANITSNMIVENSAVVSLDHVTFQTTSAISYPALVTSLNGVVNLGAGNIFQGSCQSLIGIIGGTVSQTQTLNTASTPAISLATIIVSDNGLFRRTTGSAGWAGSGVSGSPPRYSLLSGGVCDTAGGGPNYFPGGAAGTNDGSGFYG